MHMALLVGAMATLLSAADTDTTFAAGGASRLQLSTQGGDIVVRTWNRDQIRVQASHSSRTAVAVERSGTVLSLKGRSRGPGVAGVIDYEITVPQAMGLALTGLHADITIEGSRGEIEAKTVQGEVNVRGGRQRVTVQSVNGAVSLEDAQGTLMVKSVSGSVRVANSSGDLTAESVSGNVELRNIDAANVDASTVSGEVLYTGTIRNTGFYSFTSHSGTVELEIPQKTDAAFSIATMSGDFRWSGFSIELPARRPGRRFSFNLGSGRARVEAESFSGDVVLRPRS